MAAVTMFSLDTELIGNVGMSLCKCRADTGGSYHELEID